MVSSSSETPLVTLRAAYEQLTGDMARERKAWAAWRGVAAKAASSAVMGLL